MQANAVSTILAKPVLSNVEGPSPAPALRFAYSHPAHVIALVCGLGVIPFAPGTFGTLAALPLHYAAATSLGPLAHLGALTVLFAIGIWAAARTAADLGVPDHGGIVIDETVAFLLVLFFTPAEPLWQAGAFVLFRLFDIYKPPPIGHFDRTLHGGFGIMFDDIVAAGYTLLCLAALKAVID
jgi:phosphatidylglycerophosphatase A